MFGILSFDFLNFVFALLRLCVLRIMYVLCIVCV